MCIENVNNKVIGSTDDFLFSYNIPKGELFYCPYKEIFSDSPYFKQTLEDVVPYRESKAWLISNVRILSCDMKDRNICVLNRVFSREHKGPWLGSGISIGDDVLVTCNSPYLLKSSFGSNDCDSILVGSDLYDKDSKLLQLPSKNVLLIMKGLEVALFNPQNNSISIMDFQRHECMNTAIPTFAYLDSNNQVWIGTRQHGLFLLNYSDKKIQKVVDFPFNSISSIIENDKKQLWICSNENIITMNIKDTTFQFCSFIPDNFTAGCVTYRCSCALQDSCGYMFGTSNGCFTIPPSNLMHNDGRLSLEITNLQIDTHEGKRLGVKTGFNGGEHLTFSYNQNNISFEYSSVNYGNREQLMYQYKLDGVDSKWSIPSLRSTAKYTNLFPNTYNFRVRLITSQSHKPVIEKNIRVTIKRNFFHSAAAYYFYTLCLIFVIYKFHLIYVRRQRDKFKLEQMRAERIRDQKTNEMNMNFFANISHEFRNPLTLISGPLMVLKDDDSLSRSVRKSLHSVSLSVNRMLSLIDQMLDFNKLETDALKLQVSNRDLINDIQSIITPFEESFKLRGIHFVMDKKYDNLFVYIDYDKLEKIMSNLLTNALKHTPEGGRIEVCVYRTNTQVEIRIFNTGKLIEDDRISDIFKRYYQVKGTEVTHQYGWGSGLGLYYVKRLVELHHGTVSVKNHSEGVSFTVLFPIDKSAYALEEISLGDGKQIELDMIPNSLQLDELVSETEQSLNEIALKDRILIVDDDTYVSSYLRSIFSDDYVVINKYSAEAALAEIEQIKPDIVLSDVVMEEIDGYTFCEKLKSDFMTCHIPVILITAKSSINEQVEGLKKGANAYISKPFDPRYLKLMVHNLLENVKNIRKNISSVEVGSAHLDQLSEIDRAFMDNLSILMEKYIQEQDLNVTTICSELAISNTKFNYKLKELTGETPGRFFRKYKLTKAAKLLREGKNNVTEVAWMTGFGTVSHFSVAFKKQFGVSPSEYK